MRFVNIAMTILPVIGFGQSMSVQTNELHIHLPGGQLPNAIQLPTINWIYPNVEYTTSEQNEIEIISEIKSFLPLTNVTIKVGDKITGTVISTKSYKLSNDEKDYLIKQKIHLPAGANFIEVTASDKQNISVSSTREILMTKNMIAGGLAIDRKDYALIFATDKYDHWDDLVNPVDDGHAIARELKERYGFEVEIIENPTVEMVWEKLRDYNERQFKQQDQLLIFFAGHGHFDEAFGEGYVVAKNSLKKDPSRNTYISHNRLRAVVNNIPNEHILLAMDVCFGGTFDQPLTRTRGGDEEVSAEAAGIAAKKLNHRTRKYLTSGGKEYVSDGIPGKHSPFAAKLIESFQTNGGDDRVLTLLELLANLEKLKLAPRYGSFGNDAQLSDFVFLAKQGH
jgi:hypothetical protein